MSRRRISPTAIGRTPPLGLGSATRLAPARTGATKSGARPWANKYGWRHHRGRYIAQTGSIQVPLQLPSNVLSWTTPTLLPHQFLNLPVYSPFPPTTNPWLVDNMPSTLAVRSFGKWLKFLPISEAQRAMLTTNIAKTEAWWGRQPAEALETVQRVAVMMGIPVSLMSQNYDVTNFLRAMTAAISMTNWLAPSLRKKLKHKVLQSHLQALHSMILVIYILTPFTMASTLSLFQGFRIIQTRMMVLSVIHGPSAQSKAKSNFGRVWPISTICGNLRLQPTTFLRKYFPVPVCLHSFHTYYEHATGSRIQSLQKVFPAHQGQTCPSWIGSSLLEGTRQSVHLGSCSHLHGKSWLPMSWTRLDPRMAATAQLPIHMPVLPPTERHSQKTCHEHQRTVWPCHPLAMVQTQVHSRRLSKTSWPLNGFNTDRSFGTSFIHSLGSNTKTRFEQTKMPRSNDGGLTLCYALRRLANNIQEPYRTLSLQAIDASITWWQGKPAPRASPLRAPWSLSPNLQRALKQFLRKWHLQVLTYQVPCHTPSFKNGLHQARSSVGPTLQTQTGHISMVHRTKRHILLPAPVQIQKSNPE